MKERAWYANTIPSIEEDPFSTSFLRDPYPHYKRMREAGPLVYLRLYEYFAAARHDEVQKVLSDWETFSSAAGVGLANFNREKLVASEPRARSRPALAHAHPHGDDPRVIPATSSSERRKFLLIAL
jgi:cytochrome P450